jgi:hypothetical protein
MDQAMKKTTPGTASVDAVPAILGHRPLGYVQSHPNIIERVFGECGVRRRSSDASPATVVTPASLQRSNLQFFLRSIAESPRLK